MERGFLKERSSGKTIYQAKRQEKMKKRADSIEQTPVAGYRVTTCEFLGRVRFDGIILLAVLSFYMVSCNKKPAQTNVFQTTPYKISVPRFFPGQLNIVADNPLTEEGITLGRYLFYDGRMSGRTFPDSLMSCSTCHDQAHSFECGMGGAMFPNGQTYGLTGILTPHFMMPMINLAWTNHGFLWNGKVSVENANPAMRTLEDVTWMAIVAPHEIHGDTARVAALFQTIPGYPALFMKAFGSGHVTVKNMGRAIAQFVRTLISADSRFDRYLQGEYQMSPSERNGYVLFMTEQGGDCFHCHGGDGNPLFTTNLFYNNGKDSIFTDPGDRSGITGRLNDIGAYKAPTLRNLVFRPPYMHDGRYKTLDEVLKFYNSELVWSPSISPLMHHIGTHGVKLVPGQLADLKAFLLTLTDSSFVSNPAFSKPDKFPDGK